MATLGPCTCRCFKVHTRLPQPLNKKRMLRYDTTLPHSDDVLWEVKVTWSSYVTVSVRSQRTCSEQPSCLRRAPGDRYSIIVAKAHRHYVTHKACCRKIRSNHDTYCRNIGFIDDTRPEYSIKSRQCDREIILSHKTLQKKISHDTCVQRTGLRDDIYGRKIRRRRNIFSQHIEYVATHEVGILSRKTCSQNVKLTL
jgi:hypothetical protein